MALRRTSPEVAYDIAELLREHEFDLVDMLPVAARNSHNNVHQVVEIKARKRVAEIWPRLVALVSEFGRAADNETPTPIVTVAEPKKRSTWNRPARRRDA
jgi:hypothetical protein